MRPVTVSVGPLVTASANNIALSQTPTTTFTLNGSLVVAGVAILDTARRVLLTAAADESAKTFTITGTDRNGNTQTDILTGPAIGTVYSNIDFKTVTSIRISAGAAGTITVGTNTISSSMWVRLDDYAPGLTSIQCNATGTVNYTIQSTLQNPNSLSDPILPYLVTWVSTADTAGVGATGNIQSNFQFAPAYARILLNSGSGSVTAIFLQSSNGPI